MVSLSIIMKNETDKQIMFPSLVDENMINGKAKCAILLLCEFIHEKNKISLEMIELLLSAG